MAHVQANGIGLEVEESGDPQGRPLLMVMGLGGQLVHWDDDFCRLLGERGFRLLRLDNRDVGLSSKLEEAGTPDVPAAVRASNRGQPVEAPYRLDDMADDAAAVLEALGVASAHVVGVSMGGMIAQCLALRHSGRVRSLTSIMSTTGRRELPAAKPEAMQRLLLPVPTERERAAEHAVETARVLSGSGFPFDAERVRRHARQAFDRCFHPPGVARQIAAILASPPRHEALAAVQRPALVVHGDEDPLVPLEAGLDTHRSLPGSRLEVIEGMGHDLPRGAWGRIAAGLDALARAAD